MQSALTELAMAQEIVRVQEQQKEQEEMNENLAAYAADGGPIHIAKNKRGTFTAAATKHNMGVQQFASHVLANKDDYSPAMVKKANFARNASKWKHAYGGNLFYIGGPQKRKLGDYFSGNYSLNYDPSLNLNVGVPVSSGVPIVQYQPASNVVIPSVDFDNNVPNRVALSAAYDTPYYGLNLDSNGNNKQQKPASTTVEKDKTTKKPVSTTPSPSGTHTFTDAELENMLAPRVIRSREDYLRYPERKPFNPTIELESEYVNDDGTLNTTKALQSQSLDALTEDKSLPTWMRYTPIVGAAMALLNDLKPLDYSNAEQIENAARNINRFRGYRPLSNYMTYHPQNPAQYTNELRSGYAAQLRALNGLSNANPAQREALAAVMQRQYGDTIGNMLMKVAEYNAKDRLMTDQVNNAIDQYNSKMAADMAQVNQRGEQMYLSGITQGAAMRNALEAAQSAAVSSDYNSLFDSLGLVGKENASRNMINEMGMPFVYKDEDGKTHIVYNNGVGYAKCGGKLFKVKK